MSGLLILILIFIGVPIIWRWLKPYLFRWAQHRTEDYVRRQMGMPPRGRSAKKPDRRKSYSHSSGPLIPKEYAVDVEYTEIRSYSSEERIASDGHSVRYTVESQGSDAEIIEISKDR